MWLFGTGEVDIGTSQDELWDKTRSLIGIMEDDINIFKKVIIWKIQDDNNIFFKMKKWPNYRDMAGQYLMPHNHHLILHFWCPLWSHSQTQHHISVCGGWASHVPGQLCCCQHCACNWSPFPALGHRPRGAIPQERYRCLPPLALGAGQGRCCWVNLPHKHCLCPPRWCGHGSAHMSWSGLLRGSPL